MKEKSYPRSYISIITDNLQTSQLTTEFAPSHHLLSWSNHTCEGNIIDCTLSANRKHLICVMHLIMTIIWSYNFNISSNMYNIYGHREYCNYKYIDTCIYVMFTITATTTTICNRAINWHSLQTCNRSPRHINAHEFSSSLQGFRLPLESIDSTGAILVMDWIGQILWHDMVSQHQLMSLLA